MDTLGSGETNRSSLSPIVGQTGPSEVSKKDSVLLSGTLQGRTITQSTASIELMVLKTNRIRSEEFPPPPPRSDDLSRNKIATSTTTPTVVMTPPPLPLTRPKPRVKPSLSSSSNSPVKSSSISSVSGQKPPPPLGPRPKPTSQILNPESAFRQVKESAQRFQQQASSAATAAGVHIVTTTETIKTGLSNTAQQVQVGAQTVATAVGTGAQKIADGAVLVQEIARELIVMGANKFRQINQGAAKIVLVKVDEQNKELDPTKVIYQPIKKGKVRELRVEAESSQEIQKFWGNIISQKNLDQEDLSQYLVVMKKDEVTTQATKKESYETQKAEGSIDKYLADPSTGSITYDKTKQLARDVLAGMTAMHRANKLHGDLKPDNILIFKDKVKDGSGKEGEERLVARVSDYGKMRTARGDEVYMHTGNPRFAAPEGVLSKKGEVYSTALIMLSILESENLGKSASDVQVEKPSRFGKFANVLSRQFGFSKPQRRGIEAFLIDSPECPQKEVTSIQGKITVYGRGGIAAYVKTPSPASLEPAEKAVGNYIDAQIDKLVGKDYNTLQLEILRKLFHAMTYSDPAKRPTMAEALKTYDAILKE